MKSDLLGAAIAISAAVASNLGVNIQKRSHTKEEKRKVAERRPYTKRPMWWFGMFLIIFGSLGDFFALGFAGQTVVASLGGGSTIFANVVFAHFWLKQDLFFPDICGVALVTIGVILLASTAPIEKKYTIEQLFRLMEAPQFIIYTILTTGLIMTLLLRVRRSKALALRPAINNNTSINMENSPKTNNENSSSSTLTTNSPLSNNGTNNINKIDKKNKLENNKLNLNDDILIEKLIIDPKLPLYWAAISGTVGAQSVLLAKCVMEMIFLSLSGENQFKYIGTYILIAGMIITLLTQTHALNLATMTGDTMSSFPVFQAFWIGMSNISGIVFFQQAHNFSLFQWITFPSAMLVVIAGIYLISKHEKYVRLYGGKNIQYSIAMPLSIGSTICLNDNNIVEGQNKIQNFQYVELNPQNSREIDNLIVELENDPDNTDEEEMDGKFV